MTEEYELIKQFVEEHPITDYALPANNIILLKVADTPEYLREYFMWKGEQQAIKALRQIAENIVKRCRHCDAILHEQGITTQAFCMCCGRAHGGPLCGDCRRNKDE